MMVDKTTLWTVIILLGIGTFLIRFSFIGLIGNRELPEWILRLLRYTSVAVLPGLVAPLVLWPDATGGEPDPARLLAAAATLICGYLTKNVLWAIVAGISTLYLALFLIG